MHDDPLTNPPVEDSAPPAPSTPDTGREDSQDSDAPDTDDQDSQDSDAPDTDDQDSQDSDESDEQEGESAPFGADSVLAEVEEEDGDPDFGEVSSADETQRNLDESEPDNGEVGASVDAEPSFLATAPGAVLWLANTEPDSDTLPALADGPIEVFDAFSEFDGPLVVNEAAVGAAMVERAQEIPEPPSRAAPLARPPQRPQRQRRRKTAQHPFLSRKGR